MFRNAPHWVQQWNANGIPSEEALARFLPLPPLDVSELVGRWQGAGLPSGHPMDGLLEAYGWYGKSFEDPESVHPLLMRSPAGGIYSLEPTILPLRLALGMAPLLRSRAISSTARLLGPLARARRPGARLRMVAFHGVTSAAMIYDHLPIIDHFRKLHATAVLGLMDLRFTPEPFFFALERVKTEQD